MLKLLLHWLLSAVALLLVSQLVPGFHVRGLGPALVAALVIGLLNATLGLLLKIITFPLSILTLGLFLLVINGAMLKLVALFLHGFIVHGWIPAILIGMIAAKCGHLDAVHQHHAELRAN